MVFHRVVIANQLMSLFTLADSISTYDSLFGSGSGPMKMAYVRCSGSELTLLDCPYSSPGSYSSYCDSNEIAGVRCTALTGEYLFVVKFYCIHIPDKDQILGDLV